MSEYRKTNTLKCNISFLTEMNNTERDTEVYKIVIT